MATYQMRQLPSLTLLRTLQVGFRLRVLLLTKNEERRHIDSSPTSGAVDAAQRGQPAVVARVAAGTGRGRPGPERAQPPARRPLHGDVAAQAQRQRQPPRRAPLGRRPLVPHLVLLSLSP